ncbi:Mob1/phocein [Clohesyomyces aquaticus]|uniref:Mob1/phocein n=1 Tax=Clohesyomyces aquaticus TaxID=1231657 RepID=A0A1Y1ZM34_9PLEO|nr:Mob1/phocein [Clohesyomyces aquaticus]
MVASALSPSSSPRLPSPPPIAEDQLGPKSPIASSEEQQKLWLSVDHGAARRIRPGTKAADMAEGPPLVDLSEIDSAFQLTEHLKALHNFLTHAPGSETTQPIDRETAHKLAQPPDNVDKTLWLYELCRFLTQKVNSIIVALFFDTPACSATTCPEMRASEWQYLCAVHDPPKSCCAIDYCCHTLDWAANTLTSPKTFPSRLSLGTEPNTQHQQIRQLTNIFRRVYRIFAHAWFQHREMFWKVETRTGLYVLFKTVCDVYGLIPEDNYTIPSEAEGIEPSADAGAAAQATAPVILKREASDPGPKDQESGSIIEGVSEHSLSTAGTTKRHRHSPSVGATAVSTVVEEAEEEEQAPPELELHAQEQAQDALPETQPAGDVTSDPSDENADAEADADADAEADVQAEAGDSTVLSQPTIGNKQDDSSATTAQDPASPPTLEPLPAPAPADEEKESIITDEAESAELAEAKDEASDKTGSKDEGNEADAVATADTELESYSFDDATVISAHDADDTAAEEKELEKEKEKPVEKAVAEETEAEELSPAEPEKAEKAEKEDEAEEVSATAVKEKHSGEEAKGTGI